MSTSDKTIEIHSSTASRGAGLPFFFALLAAGFAYKSYETALLSSNGGGSRDGCLTAGLRSTRDRQPRRSQRRQLYSPWIAKFRHCARLPFHCVRAKSWAGED